MQVFSYDKSFEGLLCAVFDAYARRSFPDALIPCGDIPPLCAAAEHKVGFSAEKAGRVASGLAKMLSPKALRGLMLAWLSEEQGADMAIFRYIRKAFDARRSPEHDLADPAVLALVRLAKKTQEEAHRLEGFVRFQKNAEGVYFAALSPRHDVLRLLLAHFAERFANERWALYDLKRQYGFYHEKGSIREVFLEEEAAQELVRNRGRLDESLLAEDEVLLREMWKGYFRATAIPERRNPRLQRRCMPSRYWAYLTEMQ